MRRSVGKQGRHTIFRRAVHNQAYMSARFAGRTSQEAQQLAAQSVDWCDSTTSVLVKEVVFRQKMVIERLSRELKELKEKDGHSAAS